MPHSLRAGRALKPPRSFLQAREPLRSFFVAVAALAFVLTPARAQQPPPAPGEVRFFVTVTDGKGRYMLGLDKSHFSVSEGKEERALTSFDGTDAPASVGILVDISGSTAFLSKGIRKNVGAALGQLVLKGHPETQYFIAEFNTQGYMLTDWTSDPKRLADAAEQIGERMGEAGVKGNTALYDASSSALDKLAEGAHAKRVLVLFSDGQDNQSRTNFKDLRRKVQESDVLIYCVGLVERNNPGSLDFAGQALLDELAVQSGGRAFFPESGGDMIAMAEVIAVELRHQYVVGIAAADAAGASKPKWRKVKIKLTPDARKEVKKLYVRSREGYFSARVDP